MVESHPRDEMTDAQFRALLARLDWSGHLLAELMGRAPRLIRDWASGAKPVPADVAAWLWRLDEAWAAMPRSKRGATRDAALPLRQVEGFSR